MLLLDNEFRRNTEKLFSPKPDRISFKIFQAHSIMKLKKLNQYNNTANTALQHFKRKAMPQYPITYGTEEDEPMIVDPIYLSSDENVSTACSFRNTTSQPNHLIHMIRSTI